MHEKTPSFTHYKWKYGSIIEDYYNDLENGGGPITGTLKIRDLNKIYQSPLTKEVIENNSQGYDRIYHLIIKQGRYFTEFTILTNNEIDLYFCN
jgi:uncharacterized phage-associated protein